MKKLSLFFFIGLAVLKLITDSIHKHFSFFDIIFVILAGLPLLINKKWLYQLFGRIVSLMGLYIVIAVFTLMIKDIQKDQLMSALAYGMGYVLSGMTLYFGLILTGIINGSHKNSIITST